MARVLTSAVRVPAGGTVDRDSARDGRGGRGRGRGGRGGAAGRGGRTGGGAGAADSGEAPSTAPAVEASA